MDMILGGFATNHLIQLSDEELDMYENFANEKDLDIYSWVTGSMPLPEEYNNEVIRMILEGGKR